MVVAAIAPPPGGGTGSLVGIAIGDGAARGWASYDDDNHPFCMEFSPDGRWLAVQARRPPSSRLPGSDIYLIPAGGGNKTKITGGTGFNGYPAWGARGKQLYFVRAPSVDSTDSWNIWRTGIDPVSGNPAAPPEQITHYTQYQIRFIQTLGSGKLAFSLLQESRIIWSAPTAALGDGVQIAGGNRFRLSGDGRWLFHVREGAGEIGLHRTSTRDGSITGKVTGENPAAFDVSP